MKTNDRLVVLLNNFYNLIDERLMFTKLDEGEYSEILIKIYHSVLNDINYYLNGNQYVFD